MPPANAGANPPLGTAPDAKPFNIPIPRVLYPQQTFVRLTLARATALIRLGLNSSAARHYS